MPILDEPRLRPPGRGDTAWSESYYFNAYCPVADAGLFTRIGVRPNEGTMDVGLSVWLPGDELAHVHAVREQKEMVDAGLERRRRRYERVEPLKTWRLTADVDAQARDLADADASTARRARRARPHVQRAHAGRRRRRPGPRGPGRERGDARERRQGPSRAGRPVDRLDRGRRRQRHELVDARGNRDKSWGPRRWGGPKMWRWFSINIGDDVHFGGIRIGTDAGDLHRGWVWTDGEHSSIREWKVTSELADDGVTHTATHVHATDKRGRVHELDADVFRVAPGPAGIRPDTTIVNEGLARWTYEGRTGYGISEYLHQLDEQRPPGRRRSSSRRRVGAIE